MSDEPKPTREEIAEMLVHHDPQPTNGICAGCHSEGPQYSNSNHSHPDCVYLRSQQLERLARAYLVQMDEIEALRKALNGLLDAVNSDQSQLDKASNFDRAYAEAIDAAKERK